MAEQTVTVPSEELLRREIAINLNHLMGRGMEWCRKTTLDFPKAINKEKMDRITPNMPKYIEVKHQDRVDEARNNFLMM